MLLLHAEAEEIRLGDDKVDVLIVHLCDLFRGSRSSRLRGKVFQQRPRYRREEVEVGRAVKSLLEVVGDRFQIRWCRFDQIYYGDIGDGGPLGSNVP